MYLPFFGLKQEPFSIAPDPRYLFMSERHREALAHLLYGVRGGGGFVLLSGEIGAGKTTVCRCFLEQIPKRCNVAYIFNPKLTVEELLRTICEEFHIPAGHPGPASVKDYVDVLNAFLLRTHAVGQNNVLIIDEAQNLSADVLEQLRLLTNLETSERKLLQIILIGQPELRTMLARPELEQLAQRVTARFHLDSLSLRETVQYVRHRLSVAGLNRPTPFDREALQRIHELSRGVPRRINLLCDRSLLGAYATGKPRADREIVEKAALEVFGKDERSAPRRAQWRRVGVFALGAAAGAVLFGLAAPGRGGGDRGGLASFGVDDGRTGAGGIGRCRAGDTGRVRGAAARSARPGRIEAALRDPAPRREGRLARAGFGLEPDARQRRSLSRGAAPAAAVFPQRRFHAGRRAPAGTPRHRDPVRRGQPRGVCVAHRPERAGRHAAHGQHDADGHGGLVRKTLAWRLRDLLARAAGLRPRRGAALGLARGASREDPRRGATRGPAGGRSGVEDAGRSLPVRPRAQGGWPRGAADPDAAEPRQRRRRAAPAAGALRRCPTSSTPCAGPTRSVNVAAFRASMRRR
jgi:type II secretory pathway predicted ATPase ExeA